MPSLAIETEGLSRHFGELEAVRNVNLRVEAGQFFGFLGPNGAGKSTTIKMLTGLLEPTAGRIRILGLDFANNPVGLKSQIGVVPEGLALFDRLTGPEYLLSPDACMAWTASPPPSARELLNFMELADRSKSLIVDYSHGMKKKLAMAAAVIHGPKVLFLDEPFEGVDAIAAGTLKAMLNRMIARGATIFLTSHVLEIVEKLCSHVAIIHRGELVAHGSMAASVITDKNARIALSELAGLLVYCGLLGWALSVRLRAEYRGENLSEARRPEVEERSSLRAGWSLTGVSPTVAALFEKDSRYLIRYSMAYFTLAMAAWIGYRHVLNLTSNIAWKRRETLIAELARAE